MSVSTQNLFLNKGNSIIISGGDIIYTHDAATFGTEQFIYIMTDGGLFAQSVVTVNITDLTTILSSDFNVNGSADGAAGFSGIHDLLFRPRIFRPSRHLARP